MFKIAENTLKRLSHNEQGATLVEYGIAILLAVSVGGTGLLALSTELKENVDDAKAEATYTP